MSPLLSFAVVVLAAAALAEEPQRFQGATLADWTSRLEDLSPAVRKRAVAALSHFGPAAKDAILKATEDSDPTVYKLAFQAAGNYGADAFPAYEAGLSSPEQTRCVNAAFGSAYLGPLALKPLVSAWERQAAAGQTLCPGPDDFSANGVTDILPDMAKAAKAPLEIEPRLLPVATRMLDVPHRSTRIAALKTVALLGPSAASTASKVEVMTKDKDKLVRDFAKDALKAIRQ